ncbi:hypothetical protein O3P69_008974 [Scylla paramamosain]|uniref:Carbonic anhydrase n=1 Tax=Scylla paramamosain TaxID=85552 RepID=A0AAW0TSK6_SCYPA
MRHNYRRRATGPSITTDDFDVFPTTTRRPFKPKMWSYHGDTGPDFWSLTNPLCSGFRQSPLNFGLAGMKNMLVDPFNFKYYDTVPNSITLENNGHAVVLMFEMPGDPPQFTGGDLNGTYFFRQAHLHWGMTNQEGSEHLMNSRSYPAELHMVHYKADYGSITDALQHSDAAELNEIVEPKTTTTLTKPVPLQDFLPHDLSTFYRYKGSLTTPPCLELVMWTVFMDKLITTEESMAPFHKLKDVHNQQLSGNFRPKQRETELHEPYIAHTKDY